MCFISVSRPWLPPVGRGYAIGCGQLRIQLVGVVGRLQRDLSAFLCDVFPSQFLQQPRLRFSVALPLGINGTLGIRMLAGTTPILGSLYPTFELNPAVRRTARAEASPATEVAFGARRLRPLKALSHSLTPKTDGRPGGTATLDAQAACCGPPGGRRPARAVLRTATTTPPFCEVRAAASSPGIKDAPPQARRPYGSQKLDPFVRFVLGAPC